MLLSRRRALALLGAAAPALALRSAAGTAAPPPKRLGIGEHSFGIRSGHERDLPAAQRFNDPLRFLEYCHGIGAGGIQIGIGTRDTAYTAQLRDKAAQHGMFVEGSVRMPKDQGDLQRFDGDIKSAAEAGARVVRTVMLSGRRYETFQTAAAFRGFSERSWTSLVLAEPVMARHRVRLAIENHKDWRISELVSMLKRISSPWVGVCVDTGNSIALVEDPNETVEAYAPWAFATHIKDMAVREYREGFLLSEVPLGQGFLDLRRIVAALTKARPDVQYSLEMITRDPLKIPYLTDPYWATFDDVRGREAASAMRMVRAQWSEKPLPELSTRPRQEQLDAEERNVKLSLEYARQHLGM